MSGGDLSARHRAAVDVATASTHSPLPAMPDHDARERLAALEEAHTETRLEMHEIRTIRGMLSALALTVLGAAVWTGQNIIDARARLVTVESTLRDRASDAQAIQDLRGDLRELAALVRAEQPTTRDALSEIRTRLVRMEDRAASVPASLHR